MPEAPLPVATDPGGTVHALASRNLAQCGQDATFWSHGVTRAIELGLVAWCEKCTEVIGA